MGTPYKIVIDAFLRLVETDRDFFSYFRLDDYASAMVAQKRAIGFLREACARVQMECLPSVDFSIEEIGIGCDSEVSGEFGFDLNPKEVMLLSNLMYESYMARDISTLKSKDVNFTGTELRVFDPSNARKTFMAMYQAIIDKNNYLIDVYKSTDRETGVYNQIDFDDYDTHYDRR